MKIINFGSLNLDHVYDVEQIVEKSMTIKASGYRNYCGGKGLNQSVAMARAGAKVTHVGAVGADGTPLLNLLDKCGVDTGCIRTLDVPTGHAIIQVDSFGDNCIIIFGGANQEIGREQIDDTLDAAAPGEYLVIQNEISNIPYLVDRAYEKGMVICFNPSPMSESVGEETLLSKVSYLFINEIEGMLLSGEQGKYAILENLRTRFPNCSIILTLGAKGAVYSGPEGVFEQGIYKTETVDTTGAGDTFCGFFIASVSKGESISNALKYASKASSICVSRPGAAPSIPTIDEVLAGLRGE